MTKIQMSWRFLVLVMASMALLCLVNPPIVWAIIGGPTTVPVTTTTAKPTAPPVTTVAPTTVAPTTVPPTTASDNATGPTGDPLVVEAKAAVESIQVLAQRVLNNKVLTAENEAKLRSETLILLATLDKEMHSYDKKEVIDDALSIFAYYDKLYVLTTKEVFVVWTDLLATKIGRATITLPNVEWIASTAEMIAKEVKPLATRLATKDKRLQKTVASILSLSLRAISREFLTTSTLVSNELLFDITRPLAKTRIDIVSIYRPRIQGALDNFFNNKSPYRLKRQLVLVMTIERQRRGIKTTIMSDVAKAMRSADIESLSIEVNGFSAELPIDLIDDGKDATLRLGLTESESPGDAERRPTLPLTGNQAILSYQKGTILSIDFALSGLLVENLSSAMTLGFPLDAFSFEGNTNVNQLAIYRLNSVSKQWRSVGGLYDAVSHTMYVNRDVLSEYTLLKSTKTFSDISNSKAKGDIQKLLSKGTFPSAATFKPSDKLTREEFALWLVKSYGLENLKNRKVDFTDVSKSSPYYKAIVIATSEGILRPKTTTTFRPKDPLTKVEMANALAIALERYQQKASNSQLAQKLLSSTKGIPSTAAGNVSLLYELGVFSSSDLSNWNVAVSREQVVAFLSKAN